MRRPYFLSSFFVFIIILFLQLLLVSCGNEASDGSATSGTGIEAEQEEEENDGDSGGSDSDLGEGEDDGASVSEVDDTEEEEISQATIATQLAFTAGPEGVEAGSCSTVYTVRRQDSDGNVLTSGSHTITLSGSTENVIFYSDSTCLTPITTLTISETASGANFYLKDNSSESLTLTASTASLTSSTKSITVAISVSKLILTTAASTATAGSCSTKFTIQRQNANSLVSTSGELAVTLSVDTGDASFFSDSECSNSVNSVTIANSSSMADFYLQDSSIESFTITASGPSLTAATQAVETLQSIDAFISALSIPGEYSSDTTPSNAFSAPSSENLTTFNSLVAALLAGTTSGHDATLATLGYKLVFLTDDSVGSKTVVALQETGSTGGGTYLFYLSASNDFTFEVPHPAFDSNTLLESSFLFQQLKAQALYIAGTHRCANDPNGDGTSGLSTCDGTTTACNDSGGNPARAYPISDVAHNETNYFHEAHKAAHNFNNTATMFSIHGKSTTSPSVTISNGENDNNASSKSITLADNLTTNLDLTTAANADSCNDGNGGSLCGTTNVQGRFTNHAADDDSNDDACTDYASEGSDRFFHIEQNPEVRDDLIDNIQIHWVTLKNAIDLIF